MQEFSGERIAEIVEQAEKDEHGLPPVDQWHPAHEGVIDIRITSDGRWWHEGSEIQRKELVRLFSTVLRKDGEQYFLVTPVEKLKIQVDDAPFVAEQVERISPGPQQQLVFTTNVGAVVIADQEHPIRVEEHPESGAPRPYLKVRKNLYALIGRNAFYQLVEWASEFQEQPGRSHQLVIPSCGYDFVLGDM